MKPSLDNLLITSGLIQSSLPSSNFPAIQNSAFLTSLDALINSKMPFDLSNRDANKTIGFYSLGPSKF